MLRSRVLGRGRFTQRAKYAYQTSIGAVAALVLASGVAFARSSTVNDAAGGAAAAAIVGGAVAQRPNGRIVIVDPNAFTIVLIVTA
ncbi:hypothetical protein [Rhizobium tibeticum]|uniref:hypothetical protein n=1 Tax=Rhizobium tibeticum TaxID=501024 RepID=UPI00116095AF|nr:hypothetical protein [Rhizobium tibeticum]